MNGLSHIVTPDLARDLSPDLVSMLNHSRPYIRKKVVLVLYKVFLKYPEALRLSFPRLKEKLEDPDPCKYNMSPYCLNTNFTFISCRIFCYQRCV